MTICHLITHFSLCSSIRFVHNFCGESIMLLIMTKVTGALFIFKQVQPSASLWTTVSIGVPYFVISSLCNISTMVALASRLFLYRHLVRQVVGDNKQEHDAPYGCALTILIESSALHAAFSTVFVISYALESPFARLVVGPLYNIRVRSIPKYPTMFKSFLR